MPQLTLPGHDFDIPQLCLPPLASRNYCDNYCLGFLLVHSAVDCVRKWQSKATTFTYTLVPCPCTLKAGQAGVAKWQQLLNLYKALGSISCRSLPLKKKNTIEPRFPVCLQHWLLCPMRNYDRNHFLTTKFFSWYSAITLVDVSTQKANLQMAMGRQQELQLRELRIAKGILALRVQLCPGSCPMESSVTEILDLFSSATYSVSPCSNSLTTK